MENIDKNLVEDISRSIDSWVQENLSKGFSFRKYQKETIIDICYNILHRNEEYIYDGMHNHVIEAPTGSGKSLLNIISAGVLADYYERDSYILASDLYLWKQYDDFINSNPKLKKKFGCLKGQQGNYKCSLNNEDISLADCKMSGVSWSKLFHPDEDTKIGYPCAKSCPYVKARRKAMMSKVTLMTYQLWLCLVKPEDDDNKNSFKPRDILFCDECHNIPSIVYMQTGFDINLSQFKHLETMYCWAYKYINETLGFFGVENDTDKVIKEFIDQTTLESIKSEFEDIWKVFIDEDTTSKEYWRAMARYQGLLEIFEPISKMLQESMSNKKYLKNHKFTKDDREIYRASLAITNIYGSIEEMFDILSMISNDKTIDDPYKFFIKEIAYDKETGKEPLRSVVSCVKEDVLCYMKLHANSNWKVMTSATIGGIYAFDDNNGVRYTKDGESKYQRIPSTFDFTNSPIYYLNRYKMSYHEKQNNFPKIQDYIYKLCERYENKRGMIQTGSYSIAKEIYYNAPENIKKRLLLYNNSKEKDKILTLHKMKRDSILIGPTLNEGIDFPDDQCRFIILAKVPYPMIASKYVKKKIELFPKWYNSNTSMLIIQGIGRGVRNDKDYCSTYILDACFLNLYMATKDQYPNEFQDRIEIFD